MRWPFRRRATETGEPVADSAVAERGAVESGVVERPQHREWSALPPLPATFAAKAPLVIGPAPVLPPLPGRREPMPASDPALRGSVQGIASVLKPVRFERAAAEVVHRPVRRRVVVRPEAPVEPEPLTYVDEQHVEEPREPRVPHRAPAWLRYTPPAWMMQQQGDEPGIPDLPLPIMETPTPPPPPPVPVVKPKPERRMTLGQARRLGLGAPISPASQQNATQDEDPEEPAPAAVHHPPEPVHQVPELVHRPATPEPQAPDVPTTQEATPLIHESVPGELATAMRQTHGVDVADVPVVRGPVVSAQARSLGARAFTRAGKVHLPDEAGPVTSPKARGLIAHELVHAVQQRTLGLSLPSPSSEHGQALEAEAVAVERFYAGEPAAPQPLIHAPRNTPAAPVVDTHAQLAPTATVTTTPAVTPPQQPQTQQQPVIDSRVRQEVDRLATETARRVVEQEWQNPSLTPQQRQALGLPAQQQQDQQQDQPDPTAGFLEAAVLSRLRPSRMRHAPPAPPDPQHPSQPQHGPLSQTTATTVPAQTPQGTTPQQQQQQQDQPPVDSTAGFLEAAVLGRLTHHGHHLHRDTVQQQSQTPQQQQAHQSSQPQSQALTQHTASTTAATTSATADTAAHHRVDINDLDLEELSARLYTRLRSRLRLELLVDRERAGQLTDYR
ncbi:DUF4157 domain-containing protein [Kutzneria buriramensis]|uniref:Uncharacterized protein DUF4157 n=1 Tax=Kutzneria buriramensis TaxID=1045776 RepID=A0A3E0I666_9PSEU|nr:DUF4157 domain-containing protein [Kutzneria buriramensis]REH54101.1 uncharacterized protein DUF4157 [Kutzneria buriramensis]